MRYSISDTAEWGDFVSGPRIIDADTKDRMKDVLTEIQTGKFAKEWIEENETWSSKIQCNSKKQKQNIKLKKLVQKLRAMMPFINEGEKTKEKEVVA